MVVGIGTGGVVITTGGVVGIGTGIGLVVVAGACVVVGGAVAGFGVGRTRTCGAVVSGGLRAGTGA